MCIVKLLVGLMFSLMFVIIQMLLYHSIIRGEPNVCLDLVEIEKIVKFEYERKFGIGHLFRKTGHKKVPKEMKCVLSEFSPSPLECVTTACVYTNQCLV